MAVARAWFHAHLSSTDSNGGLRRRAYIAGAGMFPLRRMWAACAQGPLHVASWQHGQWQEPLLTCRAGSHTHRASPYISLYAALCCNYPGGSEVVVRQRGLCWGTAMDRQVGTVTRETVLRCCCESMLSPCLACLQLQAEHSVSSLCDGQLCAAVRTKRLPVPHNGLGNSHQCMQVPDLFCARA